MLLRIDPHNGVPIYRQLQDQIRMAIVSGVWKPGDELPTTRSLSDSLGVNPMTVSKVYSTLEIEGWLERRRGLPLVVKHNPARAGSEPEKRTLLREALQPAAVRARQLGISDAEALEEWRRILASLDPDARG